MPCARGTDLEEYLRSRGVKGLLIAGLETSVCELFTATSAYLRRIVPMVVSDACADEPQRHKDTLRMYDGLCFKVVTTDQVKGEWSTDPISSRDSRINKNHPGARVS